MVLLHWTAKSGFGWKIFRTSFQEKSRRQEKKISWNLTIKSRDLKLLFFFTKNTLFYLQNNPTVQIVLSVALSSHNEMGNLQNMLKSAA